MTEVYAYLLFAAARAMTALDDLCSLVSPPSSSDEAAIDWPSTEQHLGHALPSDYKAIVERFGEGMFDDFLWVLQPSTNEYVDLIQQQAACLRALQVLVEGGESIPYSVDPDRAELMPFALTDNGDVCYWVTSSSSDVDDWTIAVNEARAPEWDAFPMTTSKFLHGVLVGSIRPSAFPDDFPSESEIEFDPTT